MSSTSLYSGEGIYADSHTVVPACSYYRLQKSRILPASSLSKLPEVSANAGSRAAMCSTQCSNNVSTAATTNSAALLSRPPSAQLPHALPEVADNVYAPVPLRTPPVTRVLPVLPCSRGPSKLEGGASSALHAPSPNSVFRPVSLNVPFFHSSRECDAAAAAGVEQKVRPMLYPPMRTTRATPVISSAAYTNPFCPEGMCIKQLPSCSPRVLTASQLHGPLTVTTKTAALPSPSVDQSDSLWDDAATDADVLAFFGTSDASATTGSLSSLNRNDVDGKRVSKESSWPTVETTQSSICELSSSEDMFSFETTLSDNSAGCGGAYRGGAYRGSVIDVEALANFQRDGARRQREVFDLAGFKSTSQ